MNMFQFQQQNIEQITGQAKEIASLILNKQYEELENYLSNKAPADTTWAGHLSYSREGVMPVAVKARDPEAIKLLIKYNAYRYTEDKLTSDERLFLAPFYNNDNDPQHAMKSYLFLDALAEGCVQEIKYWHERKLYLDLEQKVSEQRLGNMDHPFIHCCRNGFNECVEYMIKTIGHSVNEIINIPRSYDQDSPLLAALKSGKIETANMLLSLGANVNLEVGFHTYNKASISWPIAHHICCVDYTHQKTVFKLREQSLKWLLEHGATDFLSKFPIKDDYEISSFELPALIVACKSRAVELAKILLDLQRDQWTNKGGILLEFLVMPTNSVGQDREIFRQLIDLVLPLVNPETRKEDLANVGAASIRFGSLYRSFIQPLEPDLQYMTKTEKYHYRFGPSFEDRFTLSRNGADVLKEENEDKELKVDRVSISTRTSKIPGIRKKMNIPDSSPLFFEVTAKNSDPEKHLWEAITGYKIPYNMTPRELRLLDNETGKIYVVNNAVEGLVFGRHPQAIFIDMILSERFTLFGIIIPEDLQTLSLPKNYRIMLKSDKTSVAATKPSAKRSFDEVDDKSDEQPAKRRKTRKLIWQHSTTKFFWHCAEQPFTTRRQSLQRHFQRSSTRIHEFIPNNRTQRLQQSDNRNSNRSTNE